MTLAIEPMVNAGDYDVWVLEDDWTVVTTDSMKSAHYENTILSLKESRRSFRGKKVLHNPIACEYYIAICVISWGQNPFSSPTS